MRRSNPDSVPPTLDCVVASLLAMTKKESGTPKDVFRNHRAPTFILPRARGEEIGGGTARALRRARLSAFHHGTCGRDRTPPLSLSHATSQDLFGAPVPMVRKTARIATHFYAKPANRLRLRHSRALPAPRNPSPARLHPQTGRDAGRRVSCPSRPGAKVTSLDPREPHSPRRPESPGRRPLTGARFALCTPSCDELSSARPLIGDGAIRCLVILKAPAEGGPRRTRPKRRRRACFEARRGASVIGPATSGRTRWRRAPQHDDRDMPLQSWGFGRDAGGR